MTSFTDGKCRNITKRKRITTESPTMINPKNKIKQPSIDTFTKLSIKKKLSDKEDENFYYIPILCTFVAIALLIIVLIFCFRRSCWTFIRNLLKHRGTLSYSIINPVGISWSNDVETTLYRRYRG